MQYLFSSRQTNCATSKSVSEGRNSFPRFPFPSLTLRAGRGIRNAALFEKLFPSSRLLRLLWQDAHWFFFQSAGRAFMDWSGLGTWWSAAAGFGLGWIAGFINSMAGGATLLTFPALIWLGF